MLLNTWQDSITNKRVAIDTLDTDLKTTAGISLHTLMENDATQKQRIPYNIIASNIPKAMESDSKQASENVNNQSNKQKNEQNIPTQERAPFEKQTKEKQSTEIHANEEFTYPKKPTKSTEKTIQSITLQNRYETLQIHNRNNEEKDEHDIKEKEDNLHEKGETVPNKTHKTKQTKRKQKGHVNAILKKKSMNNAGKRVGKLLVTKASLMHEIETIAKKKEQLQEQIKVVERERQTLMKQWDNASKKELLQRQDQDQNKQAEETKMETEKEEDEHTHNTTEDSSGEFLEKTKQNNSAQITKDNEKIKSEATYDEDEAMKDIYEDEETKTITHKQKTKKCTSNRVKMIKHEMRCAMCNEKECPSINEITNTNKQNQNETDTEQDEDLRQHINTPEENVNVQPNISTYPTTGKKYTMIGIHNARNKSTILEMTIDTGSYITIMGIDKAKQIGLKVSLSETKKAKTASGYIEIKHEAKARIDLGIISIYVTIAITDSPKWTKDLFLVGTDILESLHAVIDLKLETIYIYKIYPVKLFTKRVNMRKYMENIKRKYMSFKSVDIQAEREIIIKPHTSKRARITINKWDARGLENTNVYFAARENQEHIQINDLWFNDKYDWNKAKFKIIISNNSDNDKHVYKGDYLGKLKTMIPQSLGEKYLGLQDMQHIECHSIIEDEAANKMAEMIGTIPDEDDMTPTDNDEIEDLTEVMQIFNISENKIKPETEAILRNAQKVIQEMEKEEGREYTPDLLGDNGVESEENVIKKLGLPEYIRRNWMISLEEDNGAEAATRLTPRKDGSPEEIREMVNKSIQYREKYWKDRGKDTLCDMITWGAEFDETELEELKNHVWDRRIAFGNDLLAISGGVKHIGAQIRTNGAEMPIIKNKGSNRFSKELFNRFMKVYLEANIARRCLNQPHAKAFLVKKPKSPSLPRMETVEDIKQLNPDSTFLSARYRFVIDESQINKVCKPYNYPSPTPRQILSMFQEGSYILALDAVNFFNQIKCDKATSENVLTFCGPDFGCYASTAITQGHQASMSLCTQILNLIFYDILEGKKNAVWADNLIICLPTKEECKEIFIKILDRAIEFNLCIKASETQVGIATISDKEPVIEVLGLEFRNGKIRIPKRKQEQIANDPLPSTKSALDKIFGKLAFYQSFSTQFASIYEKYRTLVKSQKGRKKFDLTPDLRKTIQYAIDLFVTNPGLHLLTEEEWNTLPLVLYTDSSGTAYGASLMALKGNHLIPLSATSRSWNKTMKRMCINKKELMAIYYAFMDMNQLILNRKVIVLTDNQFSKLALNKDIEDIPVKIRTIVLTLRERYNFRTYYIQGTDNHIADILSRYRLPDAPTEMAAFDDEDFQKIKFHMRDVKVNKNMSEEIRERHEDFMKQNSYNKEDQLTEQSQNNLPNCYTLMPEYECNNENCCTKDTILVAAKDKISDKRTTSKRIKRKPQKLLDYEDSTIIKRTIQPKRRTMTKITEEETELQPKHKSLTTIHRITPELIENIITTTTPENIDRLKQADYIILSDHESNTQYIIKHKHDNEQNKQKQNIPDQMKEQEGELDKVTGDKDGATHERNDEEVPADGDVQESNRSTENDEQSQEQKESNGWRSEDPSHEPKMEHEENKKGKEVVRLIKNNDIDTRKRKREEEEEDIINRTNKTTKYDEQEIDILAIQRNEKDKRKEIDIGLNEFAINKDNSIEIIRNFTLDELDNMSHILAELESIIPEIQWPDDSEPEDEMEGESPADRGRIATQETNEDGEWTATDKGADPLNGNEEAHAKTQQGNKHTMEQGIRAIMDDSSDSETDEEGNEVKIIDWDKKIEQAQREDENTQTIIEVIESGLTPKRHETRIHSEFIINMLDITKNLDIDANKILRYVSIDAEGDKYAVKVIPDSLAKTLTKHIHKSYCHISSWKMERILAKIGYIRNVKELTKNTVIECKTCILTKYPKPNKGRKLKISSNVRGADVNWDMLELPKSNGYRYLLVGTDLNSNYVMAKKCKSKNGQEIAYKTEKIINENGLSFSHSSSDEGKEFDNDNFKKIMTKYNIKHEYLHFLQKNGNASERAISRLLCLLRKTISEKENWTAVYKRVIFSINNTAMRYGNVIETPNMIFNARTLKGITWENELSLEIVKRDNSIRQLMNTIAKARKLETTSLVANMAKRDEVYNINEKILAWSEHVLGKKKTGNGAMMKLRNYWIIGKIINKCGDCYMVEIQNEKGPTLRRYHSKQLRKIKDELLPILSNL